MEREGDRLFQRLNRSIQSRILLRVTARQPPSPLPVPRAMAFQLLGWAG